MLDINEFEDLGGLEMDGAAEWTAVSMELPQELSDGQLACLLLCKGVLKSQVSNACNITSDDSKFEMEREEERGEREREREGGKKN